MFFDRLISLFFEHASVFRAMTVDEYYFGFRDRESHFDEYEKLCFNWDRLVTEIDLNCPVYTVEVFEMLYSFGYCRAAFSDWEMAVRN